MKKKRKKGRAPHDEGILSRALSYAKSGAKVAYWLYKAGKVACNAGFDGACTVIEPVESFVGGLAERVADLVGFGSKANELSQLNTRSLLRKRKEHLEEIRKHQEALSDAKNRVPANLVDSFCKGCENIIEGQQRMLEETDRELSSRGVK